VRQIFEQFACGNGFAEFTEIFLFNMVFLSICDIKISGQLVEFTPEKTQIFPNFPQFFCSKNRKMCRKEKNIRARLFHISLIF
jgi:hypothetical protein